MCTTIASDVFSPTNQPATHAKKGTNEPPLWPMMMAPIVRNKAKTRCLRRRELRSIVSPPGEQRAYYREAREAAGVHVLKALYSRRGIRQEGAGWGMWRRALFKEVEAM
jgi:hypothetical protein